MSDCKAILILGLNHRKRERIAPLNRGVRNGENIHQLEENKLCELEHRWEAGRPCRPEKTKRAELNSRSQIDLT